MTAADVAERLGCTPTTVLRYEKQKRLKSYRLSRKLIRFSEEQVAQFIAERDY